jgi:hypothetical protein
MVCQAYERLRFMTRWKTPGKENDMPVNNFAFACEASRGYIYLIGGMSVWSNGGQLPLVPHVYEYNPEELKSIDTHDNLATCWGSIRAGNNQVW